MKKTRSFLFGMALFAVGLLVSGVFSGCGENGPKISTHLNVRNLCSGYNVSGEIEARCDDSDCPLCDSADPDCIPFACWHSEDPLYKKGFCRQCDDDIDCPEERPSCDHGWCHATCQDSAGCPTGKKCTQGRCRKPHFSEFVLCNSGKQDLEIYIDKTELQGGEDACAFSRWEWNPADQATVVLSPGSCDLFLRVLYTPPDVGEFRGLVKVFSNAENIDPLPIVLCANAFEAHCEVKIDQNCPECASCLEKDVDRLMELGLPDCSSMQ